MLGRPILQAWLFPDLNTIPNNCVRENSLYLSSYGIDFRCTKSLVRILPGRYISAMHLFICFIVTDFVCKMGACPGLAIESIIPFNVQEMNFLPNKAFHPQ